MSRLLDANKELLDILGVLFEAYQREVCYPYQVICDDTKLDLVEVKRLIKLLKMLGYVDYVRGLMDDDGMVAGSGFCINREKADEVELALEVRKLQNRPEDMVIRINGKSYVLAPTKSGEKS